MAWTEEQQAAIDTRSGDLLVAAAAGSGKTAVLVERIISMITEGEHPLDIDRLLVVTFTKAAASEMSQRIGEAISKKLETNPLNEHLQNQLTLLNRADIKTIHAFCLQVIKENYHVLDIDPSVRTADTAEVKLLQYEVMESVFEELYEENREDFFTLVESFGEDTKDRRLKELILRIYTFVQGCPHPVDWLNQMAEEFNLAQGDTLDDTIWMPILRETMAAEIEDAILQMLDAEKLALQVSGFEGYLKNIETEVDMLQTFQDCLHQPFEQIYNAYKGVKFPRLSSYKGEDIELAERIKGLRNSAKKTVTALSGKFFPYRPKLMESHVRELYPLVHSLVEVVCLFSQRYHQAKKEKMLMDFGDYEHFCLHALLEEGSTPDHIIPSMAALELQKKYDEVMIDEYQDSNILQEMILSAVSRKGQGEHNRFMVGDVKQSIYRFRLAMPEIFMEKYQNYSLEPGGFERKIILSKNFRSRANVLEGINFLFRQLMTEKLGELVYDDEAALYPGVTFPDTSENCGGENELLLIDTADNLVECEDEVSEELEELNRRELEAMVIAKRIKKLMGEEKFHVLDKHSATYRPVEFRDMTVLMRSIKSWEGVFETVFTAEGIPFYAETSMGYFDTIEVATVLNLLQIIDNPRQDIPLISVLHSPIYGFTADNLMEIRLDSGTGDYYQCAEEYVRRYEEKDNVDEGIAKKLLRFFEDLKRWRGYVLHMSISELLWHLYGVTGYFDYVGITAGGELRQANLRFLIEKAEQYEESSMKGLFHFVRYIENVKSASDDSSSAKIMNENENLVKIMTIHKSKGLEFPVVFVSDLGKEFNRADARADVILHQAYGFGLHYMDLENRAIYQTLPKTALAEKVKNENLSEEMRVLYVALTRAKEKLILTGCVKDMKKRLDEWALAASTAEQHLPVFRMQKAKHYLDWVMPALLRHPQGIEFLKQEEIEMWGEPYQFVGNPSKWQITLVHKEEIYLERQQKKEERKAAKNDFLDWDMEQDYSGKREEIFKCLDWIYPYREATCLPAKVTVSEVKRKQFEEGIGENGEVHGKGNWAPVFRQPCFVEKEETLTSAQVGTAMHRFMEYADFRKHYDDTEIEKQILVMKNEDLLTELEGTALNREALCAFFDSELAQRMRKSERIEKERPFAMTMTPKELFLQGEYGDIQENVLINGIIDCFFYEGEDIVLLDYKNDRVPIGGEEVLKEKYQTQIQIYRKALERIVGAKVKECYLYSFDLNKGLLL